MGLLLTYAFFATSISFLCSLLEAVLLSVSPTFLNLKKVEGKTYALTLEELKKDVDKPLISILTLNTIAHTVGAMLVGIQAKIAYADMYGAGKRSLFGMEFTEDLMVGVVSAILTILILVASEIIPKTIGAHYWKQLVHFTTICLKGMVFFMKWTGLLWLLQLFTRLIGSKGEHGSVLSREEFSAMTEMAHEGGQLQESESKVIRNLLRFEQIKGKDVMTPRTVMKIASEDDTIKAFFEANRPLRYSRIPLYKDRMDNITGYFLKDQLMEAIINKQGDEKLASIRREIMVTVPSKPLPELLERLVANREHITLLVDEYGSVSGLVSMEDVIETLLGYEIMDESDNVEDLQMLARMNWEARAKRLGIIDDNEKVD